MELKIIPTYFPSLTQEQYLQLSKYCKLLKEWNGKVNLISRKDEEEIESRHVLHSLAIAKVASWEQGSSFFDLGTGGGLPGIPLAILRPDCTFHLNDSIGKKIRAVQDMIDVLGLKNATSAQERAEEHNGMYDHIITRAVAPSAKLVKWTKNITTPEKSKIYALKGGDLTDELKAIKNVYKVIDMSTFYEAPFFETKKVVVVEL